MAEGLLVAEGGRLELDLIGSAVGELNVSALGEGDAVFRPLLTEVLGAEFLEDFALVVLAFGFQFFKELDGAEHDGFGVEFENFALSLGGLETDAHSVSTAGTVKLADHRQDVAFCKAGNDVAVFGKAENVIVGIGFGIVAVKHCLEKCGVVHSGYLLSCSVNSIA